MTMYRDETQPCNDSDVLVENMYMRQISQAHDLIDIIADKLEFVISVVPKVGGSDYPATQTQTNLESRLANLVSKLETLKNSIIV